MCQMKSDTNSNVHSFGFLDRNQKMIVTYSRSKLARTKSMAEQIPINDCITISNEMDTQQTMDCNDLVNLPSKLNLSSRCDNETVSMEQPKIKCMPSFHNDGECTENFISSNQSTQSTTVFTTRQEHYTNCCHKNKSKTYRSIGSTKVSDFLLVILCFLTVNQVFAKPYPSVIVHHHNQPAMSLEAQLRSPCGIGSAAKEELTRANVQEILNVITTQTANAKAYAFEDVEKYMSHRPPPEIIDNTVDSDKKLKYAESPETRLRDYHETWSSKFLKWLYPHGKELQKEFLEPLPADVRSHFVATGRNFDLKIIIRMLQDCDERFQLLLVGFHHMLELHQNQRYLMDLEKYNPLLTILSRVKNNTRLVLCEIRSALQKLGASYTIIDPSNIQSSKEENENTPFYEWIIFREYLNQLEHLHQVIDAIDDNINGPIEGKSAFKSLSG